MKAKVFTESTIQRLENALNGWLEENSTAEIKFVAQSESDASDHGWSATTTIFYTEKSSHYSATTI